MAIAPGAVEPLVSPRIIRDIGRGHSSRWMHTALRGRNHAILDILARHLTNGEMDADRLRGRLLAEDLPIVANSNARAAAALGTIWASIGSGNQDARAGHALLGAVTADAPNVLTPKQQQIYAQVSFLLGEYRAVQDALDAYPAIPPEVSASLRTDLLNPTLGDGRRRAEWLERLAAPFESDGLAPITVAEGEVTLFDGLRSTSPPDVDGPLVTVIMPCYRPDEGLLTSVGSILAQSHRNLEIILVDDASGPAFEELFEQVSALDPRIQLLRMERNGGTYRCRNAALEIARGDFVTVQDADDWSHPSRLAAQVRVLRKQPSASASRSDAIRATDDLTHQWVGYSPRRRNASSLMFRRSVVERIGPFDLVRKSGDSEYHERLACLVGPVLDVTKPLAITRLRAGTLSRSDFSFQWMAPDRHFYRSAYRSWHRTLANHTRGPVDGATGRAFPAPPAMLGGLPGSDRPRRIGIIILLDASDPEAAAEALAIAHVRPDVGAIHFEDATRGRSRRPEPSDSLLRAHREGVLELFSPSVEVDAPTTVVLSTGILELPPTPSPRVRTDKVVLVARPATGRRNVQDHLTIMDSSKAIFGCHSTWVAASQEDQAQFGQDGWRTDLLAHAIKKAPTRADARQHA